MNIDALSKVTKLSVVIILSRQENMHFSSDSGCTAMPELIYYFERVISNFYRKCVFRYG